MQNPELQIKKYQRKNLDTGFTIIEILVYLAILATLTVIEVNTLLLIQRSLGEIRVTRTLSASASVAMERMIRVIRDAKAVDAGSSTFDVSPGILTLSGSETPANIYRFSVSGGTLKFESSASPETILTPPGVVVEKLLFRMITANSTSQAVKVELTLASSSGRATTTQNFYGTTVLRNSYAK